MYNFSPDSKLTFQALGGSGIQWWNVLDLRDVENTASSPALPRRSGSRKTATPTAPQLQQSKVYAGLGVEYASRPGLLRAQARIDYLFHSATDNTGASDTLGVNYPGRRRRSQRGGGGCEASVDANDLIPSLWFGVTYWFGERDGDQDGIPNRLDKCVDRPRTRTATKTRTVARTRTTTATASRT